MLRQPTTQVVIDTETTGLSWRDGNRLIEIACIEIIDRRITGRKFHCYLHTGLDIDPRASALHGITTEFLADKPRFEDVVDALLDFIRGGELLAHNASFDIGFINHELSLLSRPLLVQVCERITDTLEIARQLRPGMRNGIDSLCEAYRVDNTAGHASGALHDARLLAGIYLAMTNEKPCR